MQVIIPPKAKADFDNERDNELLKCCRCRNKHLRGERIDKVCSEGWAASTCPRCSAESYYNLTAEADMKGKPLTPHL